MIENKLKKLIEESYRIRNINIANKNLDYHNEDLRSLDKYINKVLYGILKKSNAKIIVNYFDQILPLLVTSNINILLLNSNLLVEQPNFKEQFIKGLKNYPYKDHINEIFYNMYVALGEEKFNDFIDNDILEVLSSMNLNVWNNSSILNELNEKNQKDYLTLLVTNKCNIPYLSIEYKGNNKQIIYDNIDLFIENAQNLYKLMSFVKDNEFALSKVKKYIDADTSEEKAINSIFCETDKLKEIADPLTKECIRLIILEVMKNENVNFSDITYNGGGFSRVLLVGNKVIKLGSRIIKGFPNNPYIISPLLRKELKSDKESCFVEVTERVDTLVPPSQEELYELYKNLRDLSLIWTDIKATNVGRLKKDNIIHWNEDLQLSDDALGFKEKRGSIILKEGDPVILDADFIFDENDPNIDYSNQVETQRAFEERYQKEKKEKLQRVERMNNTLIEEYKANQNIETENESLKTR